MKNLSEQLDAILKKHQAIEKKLSNQEKMATNQLIELNKEYSDLTPIVDVINEFNTNKKDLLNLYDLLKDKDTTIKEMAENEIKEKNANLKLIEANLLKSLCSI